ncbi:helix-turn-helix domain-containing protein [Candidatus Peregrinibacteria bacterium]|nr:helix-turn-helix domain-containing protein [Candidatus Peregrinibacteria bacterium]
MDEILTSEQVAKLLQVHPFTVLKFIKNGKLKASKIGRVYRIRRSEVERFLDSNLESSEKPVKKKKKTKGAISASPEKKKKRVEKQADVIEVKEVKEVKDLNPDVENDPDHYILRVNH